MPFHPAVEQWFAEAFDAPTPPQAQGWPAIARGESTLIFAPTGSGKTLAAFLSCLDRLMFSAVPGEGRALPRALRLADQGAGRGRRAQPAGADCRHRARGHRARRRAPGADGEHPHRGHAGARPGGFLREPADILITTPESLFLLLTSRARHALRSVETVIVDDIHALVPTKRGAHLALSLERLEQITGVRCSASAFGDAAAARRGRAVPGGVGRQRQRHDHSHDGPPPRQRAAEAPRLRPEAIVPESPEANPSGSRGHSRSHPRPVSPRRVRDGTQSLPALASGHHRRRPDAEAARVARRSSCRGHGEGRAAR